MKLCISIATLVFLITTASVAHAGTIVTPPLTVSGSDALVCFVTNIRNEAISVSVQICSAPLLSSHLC
jgi:hypothetical protein